MSINPRFEQLDIVCGHSDANGAGICPDCGRSLVECHGLDTPERVHFYEQEFYPLSNFSAFNVEIWGVDFDTSEHAYHWAKFGTGDDDGRAVQHMVRGSRSAHEAFKVAEINKEFRRPDWDDVKLDVMRSIIRAKFAQHEYVRRKLQQTGDREIVENSWRDSFWGWGPNRDGQNWLGRLWMELRAEVFPAAAEREPRA